MQRSNFFYELPEDLIAQYPSEIRGDNRLLCLDSEAGEYQDRQFDELISLINPEDLLVFNDTRVLPARLFGQKDTGGKLELLVERLLDEGRMLAQIRASKSPKPGSIIVMDNDYKLKVNERQNDFFVLSTTDKSNLLDLLDQIGHVPLPPYIKRPDENIDRERYQTIFAQHPGSVAAPTAGLHFTNALLEKLKSKGIAMEFITLHVGAGTFQPVRTEEIEHHAMHSEWFEVTERLCASIKQSQRSGGRVIAVGTTTVRSLETVARDGEISPCHGETDIFIYPGFEFRIVDAMITNFHLPESTLLMLVCAFAGTENVLHAYQHAVKARYRFFSYGDAMFLMNRASILD